jgi:hypothetical protein
VRIPEIVLGFLLATAFWLLFGIISLPDTIAAWLAKWQILTGATVASIVASTAAYIAFHNTSRSIRNAEDLEKRRRSRKHAAIRAVLPLALAQVTDYAERTARASNQLVEACQGETLPHGAVQENFVQPLPSETLQALADFIEYSDTVDVSIVEEFVAWIQIHDSRLRAIVERNRDPLRFVLRTQLRARVIDAASIYTAASIVFAYARRQQERLPNTVSWDAIRQAMMMNLQIWNNQYHEMVLQREGNLVRPFESPAG